MRVWFYGSGVEELDEAAYIDISDELSDDLTDTAELYCWTIADDDFSRPAYLVSEIEEQMREWLFGWTWPDYGLSNLTVMNLMDDITYISTMDIHDLEE